MKCPQCNKEGLEPSANYQHNRILINPGTEMAHVCNPGDKIIQYGKWKGFTHKEAADISDHVERTHKAYLESLREMFKSPYASADKV